MFVPHLSQDLQQVLISDKVEAGHGRAFLFQEIGQSLLAPLQLVQRHAQLATKVGEQLLVGQREQPSINLDLQTATDGKVNIDSVQTRLSRR